MSIHSNGDRWVVRWREDGTNRALTFAEKQDAEAFDQQIKTARREAREARAAREAIERTRRA